MKTHIDYRFKILYAVGIIMVVAGHCQGGGFSLLTDWFPYSGLHVPLFIFCSGYFYKSSYEGEVWRFFCRKIKTLIIPLYIYNVAYGIWLCFLRHFGFKMGNSISWYSLLVSPLNSGHQFLFNLSAWFIIPLWMVEISNVLFRKVIHSLFSRANEFFFFFWALVIGLVGNQMACVGMNKGWWLTLVRFLYFVPFYAFGIFYSEILEKYDKRIPSFFYFSVVYLIKLCIICFYGHMVTYSPSWCADFTEGPIMPIIIGFLGIALWLRIATILEPVIGRSKWLNVIANNTFSIMMNQFLGFFLLKAFYGYMNYNFHIFDDFNWKLFKTDIWYYYVPNEISHMRILYVIFGITIPLVIQMLLNVIASNKCKVGTIVRRKSIN